MLVVCAFAQAQAQTPPVNPPPALKTRPVSPAPAADRPADPRLAPAETRLTDVAERFSETAQQHLGRETLEQRVIQPRSVRKAKGNAIAPGSSPKYDHRQIVSFYSFTTVGKSTAVHEVRQILTVDKERLLKEAEGRSTFRTALQTHDDEVKSRLLGAFGNESLNGVATDLGQMILLFDKNSIKNFVFEFDRDETIGSIQTMVIRYTQRRGTEGVHIDEGRTHTKGNLSGWLWVRLPDYLPIRITMVTTRTEKKHDIRDEAEVDYAENPSGALLPSAVIHRRFENDILAAEDDFRYTEWQSLK